MSKSEYQKIISEKNQAKKELFQDKEKNPILIIFAPKKKQQLYDLLEGLLQLSMQIVVISEDDSYDTEDKPTGKITWINPLDGKLEQTVNKYIQASDIGLVFDDKMEKIRKLIKNGVIVIGPTTSIFLENYNPVTEEGNSFTYKSANQWSIFKELVRATETYKFEYDWNNLIRNSIKHLQ